MGRFFAGMTDVWHDTTLSHVLSVQSTCRSSRTRKKQSPTPVPAQMWGFTAMVSSHLCCYFLSQEKGVRSTPCLAIRNKVVSKNFYIAEEGNDMNRYEFILADGSHIAVYAESQWEAAKKVREMLNA